MQTFNKLLLNTLVVNFTNNFLWFALVFWAYLETQSVLATSIIGGSYMLFSAMVGMLFGTYVDQHKKKQAMVNSSFVTLLAFIAATALYFAAPDDSLLRLTSPIFWLFVCLALTGVIAGNLRNIALSTTVTLLVPEDRRDKANGLVGTVSGLSFTLTSVFSGLAIGWLGMGWTLLISVAFTVLATSHIMFISLPEKKPKSEAGPVKKIDIKGAMQAINLIPGLLALIFFSTFNNFLGGVFMSLLDPYGLTLMSVEAWGIMLGAVSTGFIAGGMLIAKKGLGKNPLKTLLLANITMWLISILFPIKSAIWPLAIGMFLYMCLVPTAEAAEQTIIQKVVPYKRQGRVFGFAQTIESAASPVTAFLIGPIAQLWAIPFMTDGLGARTVGSWFGTGPNRGMAIIFIAAGIIGLIITLLAFASKAYRILSDHYKNRHQNTTVPPEALPDTPLV